MTDERDGVVLRGPWQGRGQGTRELEAPAEPVRTRDEVNAEYEAQREAAALQRELLAAQAAEVAQREAEVASVVHSCEEPMERFVRKNAQYTGARSVFDNFRSGAALTRGKLTAAQVLLVYMGKHVNRLYDGAFCGDQPMGADELDEVGGDIQLYTAILRGGRRLGLL